MPGYINLIELASGNTAGIDADNQLKIRLNDDPRKLVPSNSMTPMAIRSSLKKTARSRSAKTN